MMGSQHKHGLGLGKPEDHVQPGVVDKRVHDLGLTFAALSLQNGVDVKTLSNTLGHYSAGFTLYTYTHATQRMKREAADTIGNVIDQAM